MPMMLGQVKSVEAAGLGALEEGDAILVGLRRRHPATTLDVVENSELDIHKPRLP
jgi:hypothetical protein